MPEKSVREMSSLERKHYSLEARTFHAAVIGSVVLGLAAFIIGIGLYTYAMINQYIGEAFQLSRSAVAILQRSVDVAPLADDVLSSYRGLSGEEREAKGTEAYRAASSAFTEREDYQEILSLLGELDDMDEMDSIYLVAYDSETSAMVYLADPVNEESRMQPGDWEYISPEGFNRYQEWDGKNRLFVVARSDSGWICTSGYPLINDDGELVAIALTDISLRNVISGMKLFVILYLAVLSAATLIVGWFFSRHMNRTLVQPINEIARAAQDYVSDKQAGAAESDHFALLNIRTGDEIENLSLIMADMEHDLSEYMEDLTKVTREKEHVTTELNMATQIQESMLPSIYPAFPDRSEFDIYATMDPAREVGGDFYDFFLVDEDHLCMVMADVSGKGVPAALFMMVSKIILQNNAMMGKSPAAVLTDANTSICANNKMEMFVTVWLGILELSTGRLTAANAGHEYPAIRHRDGPFELYKDKHGFVIGGMEGMKYTEYELMLAPGDKLFLYTDGVPEATDTANGLFGTERMLAALNQDAEGTVIRILGNVKGAVDEYVQDAEQFDDLTMLCMEYKGGEA